MISCIEISLFLYRKFPQSRGEGSGIPYCAESTVRVEKAEAARPRLSRAHGRRSLADLKLPTRSWHGAGRGHPATDHTARRHSPGGCPWTGSHAAPSSFEKSGPNFPG